MRPFAHARSIIAMTLSLALAGCLVSEVPLLTAANGAATPLAEGAYEACSIEEKDAEPDCTPVVVSVNFTGLYRMDADGDDPVLMRMRKVERHGYAVQVREGENEYAYYYGDARNNSFRLTFMMCTDLPENLRSRLIDDGDIVVEDGDIPICVAKSQKALDAAARAYHRGAVNTGHGASLFEIDFVPAPEAAR